MEGFGGETEERRSDGGVAWGSLKPKEVGYENAMGKDQVKEMWKKIYERIGRGAKSEKERQAIRLAVYTYAMINGTSREGTYGARIRTSDGTEFSAAVIPQVTGKLAIRKFFRGCMHESYEALKESDVAADYPEFISKAASLGIPADCAFAMADWFTDCALFTPLEAKAHLTSFNNSVARAQRSRGGRKLEEVEQGRLDDSLESQGPMVGGPIDL